MINTATISHNEYLMRDVRNLAAKHGYFYGRTGMPEYHNLRLMLDVAQDVARICPEAWILQAGNPVFAGTTLMHRETGVKVCGLCHGHYGYRRLASTLGLDPDEVTWQAPGLNHNIWLTHFYYEGKDAYPLLDDWIAERGRGVLGRDARGRRHPDPDVALGDPPVQDVWPDADRRHAAQRRLVVPHRSGDAHALVRRPGRRRRHARRPRPDHRRQGKKVRRKWSARPTMPTCAPSICSAIARPASSTCRSSTGWSTTHEGRFQVNVPNHGALAGLPDDVAVEVPAVVNAKGIQPLRVGALPPKVMLEKIYPTWLSMERTLEAFRSGDKSMLLYGILDSHQTRTYDQAVELLDALLAMPKTEPMAYVKDINDHFKYPDIW